LVPVVVFEVVVAVLGVVGVVVWWWRCDRAVWRYWSRWWRVWPGWLQRWRVVVVVVGFVAVVGCVVWVGVRPASVLVEAVGNLAVLGWGFVVVWLNSLGGRAGDIPAGVAVTQPE
jgi:amino acid transporter